MEQSNIVFFGTSPRSARFLEQALKNGLKVDLVVSEPLKPIGKKQVPTENPTVTLAKKLNISFITSINELSPTMKQCNNITIGLILDFNKIIPNKIINLFSKGIINIHFSKLPAYRGPAPVQYTILNGEKEAWITYYLINENLDEGYILTQTSLALDFTENTETLYQKLITKTAMEISQVIDDHLSDKTQPHQQEGIPSSTKKLNTENCKIDWTKPTEQIERLIRAAYPEPGAWTEVNLHGNITQPSSRVPPKAGSRDPFPRAGERDSSMRPDVTSGLSRNDKIHRIKILKAHLENNKLELDLVQLEGKNPVTWKQFQEGHPTFSLS